MHTGGMEIIAKGDRPFCRRCAKLVDRLEKTIAETRIAISLVQKSSAKRAKPVQMLVDINKEIAESMKALGSMLDDADNEIEKDTHRLLEKKIKEKTSEIEKVVGKAFDAKPLVLLPKKSELKGIGVADVFGGEVDEIPEYDDPPDLTECLKCNDVGYRKSAHGVPMPCDYCNPGGKAVTIPGEHITCPWCHAKKPMAYSCMKCDGAGHVPFSRVYRDDGVCKFCRGFGAVYADTDSIETVGCEACGGKGNVKPPVKSPIAILHDEAKTLCLDCGGKGHVVGQLVCKTCQGKDWTI